MKKKQLGQFFTKNSNYILRGLEVFIDGKEVTDPFAGDGDLIEWARKNKAKDIRGYDIDRKYVDNKDIFYNDSINRPLDYNFILTNPPYLHKNKATKEIKDNDKRIIRKTTTDIHLFEHYVNVIFDLSILLANWGS